MSESYSPSGTYPTFPLTLPLDGEVLTHATVVDAILKKAIDGIGWLKDRTAPTGTIEVMARLFMMRGVIVLKDMKAA